MHSKTGSKMSSSGAITVAPAACATCPEGSTIIVQAAEAQHGIS
jgi:hypothetical protein